MLFLYDTILIIDILLYILHYEQYQNESEITNEVGNQLIRDKKGLDSFPAWDPSRTTALATAIAFLMCTTPPPKGS